MAGKRSPHSILGRPLVGPGLIYARAKTYLATQRSSEYRRRATAKSALRPPTAVGPPVITPRPKTALAFRQPRPRHTVSFIGKPIVGPPVVTPAAKVTLARRHRLQQRPVYAIRPPAVVAAGLIYASARLNLARLDRRRLRAGSQRGIPVVAPFQAPQVLPAPPVVKLAQVQRQRQFQRVQHIVGVPIVGAIVFPAPQVTLARRTQKLRPVVYWLHAPTAVNPAVTFPAAHRYLATRSRRLPGAVSVLRAPTVISPFVPPVVNVQSGTDWAAEIATF